MKNIIKKYYLFTCLGVTVLSAYPLYMGARVIIAMISEGTVMKENYPKYIIPYTPICVAVLLGLLLLPIMMKYLKKYAVLGGSAISVGAFFVIEMLFENKVVVTDVNNYVSLKDWQMYMCWQPPASFYTDYKKLTPVEILMGEYDPAFKLHFYIISIVLILAALNCLYGFAQMIKTGDKKKLKALILQSVSTAVFLALCILACFTAFWRDGNLKVSPLSAFLMTAFFILLGTVSGIFVGSFLLGKKKSLSVAVPGLISAIFTAIMYIGEMILLNGHLYIFGESFIFASIPGIILSVFDILVIIVSAGLTALIFLMLQRNK